MLANFVNFIGTLLALVAYLFLTMHQGAFVMSGYHWAVQLVICLSVFVVGINVIYTNTASFLKRYLLVLLMGFISTVYYNSYEYFTTAVVVGQPIAGLIGFLVAIVLRKPSDEPLVGNLLGEYFGDDKPKDPS